MERAVPVDVITIADYGQPRGSNARVRAVDRERAVLYVADPQRGVPGTGFDGTVTITYVGGTGNDVLLNLVAAGLTGDHNGDGVVDAADYVAWRKSNINGGQGYSDWMSSFGEPAAGAADNLQVPEPQAWIMMVVAAIAIQFSRRRNLLINRTA